MNTRNESLKSVKQSCKTAAAILNIFKILAGLGSVCFLVFAGGALVLRDKLVEFISSAPEISTNITANIRVAGLEFLYRADEHAPYTIAMVLFIMAISALFLAVAFHYLEKLFTLINTGDSPFSRDVLNTMITAFVLIAVFVTLSVGLLLGLFMALILWCIFNIFRYGQVLQEESDETL